VKKRVFFRLLASFVLVIAAATVTLDVSVRHAWERSQQQEIARNLREKAAMFANRVNGDRQHSIQDIVSQEGQAAGARATVIDVTGKVLADSQAEASTVESDAKAPEFDAALKGQVGTVIRANRALGIRVLYVAAPIAGGAVRLAYPLSGVEVASIETQEPLVLGAAVAFGVALIMAATLSRPAEARLQEITQFAQKMAAGELTARIAQSSSDEIGQVAVTLDQAAHHLEERFAALQTSQRQLETLLNSMEDAVIAVGSDERVQWANQSMDALTPQRTRLNAPVEETVRDPDFLRAVRGASLTRKVMTTRATSIVPARTFDVTAAPLPGGGAVAVLRDLTETERVEKTRRDFIANVSHELRTPLTSIQGYAETLLDSAPDNDHSREFLEIVRKNAYRMSRLTEDLLTLARVESGEHRFDVQPVPAAELLQEAVISFRERARALGIELQIEEPPADLVSADREAIHQVFTNLIDNALKYGASGGRIVLGAKRRQSGVEFYVRDNGPGIPSEHLPRLFERFYRVDKARSRESGGTGLGLAIAKHIVLAHEGNIRAESELNHGSTFFFTLPLASESTSVS
jgi:two-component system phosphate regulon sensor histidine kinase PhoR